VAHPDAPKDQPVEHMSDPDEAGTRGDASTAHQGAIPGGPYDGGPYDGGRDDGAPTGPAGDVVDWYRRAVDLLDSGDDAAAAVLLERALVTEPSSPALQEAMGRARFGSRRYAESADLFGSLVERDPTDHYARYGLGLALSRLGRQEQALEHLAVAVAMRPGRSEYDDALRQARATVDARRAAAS